MTNRRKHHASIDDGALSPTRTHVPLWVSLVVVLAAGLMALGAVIAALKPAMLASPHDEINGAVRVYAGYLISRNGAIALLLAWLLLIRAWKALGNLMTLVGTVQLFDACVDAVEARWTIVPGVLGLGVLFLVTAARLSGGHPFWRARAWSR